MSHKRIIPVLSIAGSDPSGGAGIQADIKTISAAGCYAMTAITALTVQNTCGVSSVHCVNPELVTEQARAVFRDIFPMAVKIGMIGSPDTALEIARLLNEFKAVNVVIDPVLKSTDGAVLSGKSTADIIRTDLMTLSTLITPNMDEASVLSGIIPSDREHPTERDCTAIITALHDMGADGVLLTGVNTENGKLCDRLSVRSSKIDRKFEHERVESRNTHGTGCTLSSAIAAFLARGFEIEKAVAIAVDYVHEAIVQAAELSIGNGTGPLNHLYNPQKMYTI